MYSHASSITIEVLTWFCQLVVQSITLIKTEICQQLLDG